jgi:hypothetical protein
MKASVLICLLFASGALADEASDRHAIERVITAANAVPPTPAIFTADSDAPATLERLRRSNGGSGRPAIAISHDPWGEANWSWSHACAPIIGHSVRFITADVALADAVCPGDKSISVPVLFVMRRDGPDWKIASLRLLAPR